MQSQPKRLPSWPSTHLPCQALLDRLRDMAGVEDVHGFDVQQTGLSFLGIGLGMALALATQPYWNRIFSNEAKKHNGHPPPEVRLIIAMTGAILAPMGKPIVGVILGVATDKSTNRPIHYGVHDV